MFDIIHIFLERSLHAKTVGRVSVQKSGEWDIGMQSCTQAVRESYTCIYYTFCDSTMNYKFALMFDIIKLL